MMRYRIRKQVISAICILACGVNLAACAKTPEKKIVVDKSGRTVQREYSSKGNGYAERPEDSGALAGADGKKRRICHGRGRLPDTDSEDI